MNAPTEYRLVGIDYGRKRVGIAISDPLRLFATPYGTFPTAEIETILERIVDTMRVEAFVIGFPFPDKDDVDHVSTIINHFATRIGKRFSQVKIELVDERFSSQEAREAIRRAGTKKAGREKKERIDAAAAAIILQRYLDER